MVVCPNSQPGVKGGRVEHLEPTMFLRQEAEPGFCRVPGRWITHWSRENQTLPLPLGQSRQDTQGSKHVTACCNEDSLMSRLRVQGPTDQRGTGCRRNPQIARGNTQLCLCEPLRTSEQVADGPRESSLSRPHGQPRISGGRTL